MLYAEKKRICIVAPLVGAWIEILFKISINFFVTVAPLVGAWIEIEPRVIAISSI